MAAVATDPIAVLKAIKDIGTATAGDAGTSAAYVRELEAAGLVTQVGTLKTGRRGRPAATFKVTKKGADRVRRKK